MTRDMEVMSVIPTLSSVTVVSPLKYTLRSRGGVTVGSGWVSIEKVHKGGWVGELETHTHTLDATKLCAEYRIRTPMYAVPAGMAA